MNTKHLRQCAALLRDGAACAETVAEQLEEAANEIDRLQAEHRLMEKAAAMRAVELLHSFGISMDDAMRVAGFEMPSDAELLCHRNSVMMV